MSAPVTDRPILYFDCFAGLSGDMTVAALIDLGVPFALVQDAVARLPLTGYRLSTARVVRKGLAATRFLVEVDEAHQPHRHYDEIVELIGAAPLAATVQTLALEIFRVLGTAEAKVHGVPLDHVHFHEVGAVDSIVDIVGAAAAIVSLDARVVCRPVPLGSGTVETAHGLLPVPAPATLEVLTGVPTDATPLPGEVTTPTGAAIVKAAAASFGPWPSMTASRVGLGAGSREGGVLPNVLRVALGTAAGDPPAAHPCVVVEATIDDMTGQLAAHVMERLFAAGALDVWLSPVQMKKGRPGLLLGILSRRQDLEALAAVLFAESTTIGLRWHEVGRLEMVRTIETVTTPWGPVAVKISRGPGGSHHVMPEYEDARRLALAHGVPLKDVLAAAAGLALSLLNR